ncbi:DNA mismatch repair protein msh-2 [Trichophyton interdigitale]|uniref:DNA mismatch repair protein msh-2 n=1 Tax=Trichophyton interdigitale TaxID=101480 RepID=A0A9P4YII1_9EURO|nr:DNA mismatch repair protein msh-2 [Trichophyton interdigitale]KAF3894508.1 DNA mismatch repair protein msh-2 [Trichophyton interdigitale]KAG8208492.1 DNA mismatch repair protein msh-2 [Trichophyton interdigitale]
MAVKTRRATTTRASTARLPTKQPGITAFSRVGKAGAGTRTASSKETLSLKRKIEEPAQGDSELVQQTSPSDERTPAKRSKIEPTTEKDRPSAQHHVENSSDASTERASVPSSPTDSSHSERPSEFLDLVDLNSAFLSALSLHFAHNGAMAPANIRDLLSSTERIWNKRKVALQDIQRVLHVQGLCRSSSQPQNGFILTSYGTNTFVERKVGALSSKSRSTSPLNDKALKAEFLANLESYRDDKGDNDGKPSQDLFQTIPLAPIHPSRGSAKAARGQKTIEELFGSLKSKPMLTREPCTKQPAPLKESTSTNSRRNGLLERMKMKALRQSKLPPPPSKDVVLKQTALGRISEVINVLLLLSPLTCKIDDATSNSTALRKSYTMDLIIQRIEDSMRTPASKEEIETCIEILSQSKVAKDWVTIVKTSQVKSVVLRSDRRPSPAEITNESMSLKF